MAEIFKLQRPLSMSGPIADEEGNMLVLAYNKSREIENTFVMSENEWGENFGDAIKAFAYTIVDESGKLWFGEIIDEKDWPDW